MDGFPRDERLDRFSNAQTTKHGSRFVRGGSEKGGGGSGQHRSEFCF